MCLHADGWFAEDDTDNIVNLKQLWGNYGPWFTPALCPRRLDLTEKSDAFPELQQELCDSAFAADTFSPVSEPNVRLRGKD